VIYFSIVSLLRLRLIVPLRPGKNRDLQLIVLLLVPSAALRTSVSPSADCCIVPLRPGKNRDLQLIVLLLVPSAALRISVSPSADCYIVLLPYEKSGFMLRTTYSVMHRKTMDYGPLTVD